MMSSGSGYTSAPTTAAVISGGTATCSGSSVSVSTYLNGVIDMLATAGTRLQRILAQWNKTGFSGGQIKGLVSLIP